jgi:AcrR family transcriptional regulator
MQHAGTATRTGTRERVQKVALELFAEQGYDKTSLREISERLGVTKAALYYHFKSKEDIVRSFTDDHYDRIDELIAWARSQPPGEATRRELLERYIGLILGASDVFRFIEQNRASMQAMDAAKGRYEAFRSRLDALVELLAGPGAPLRNRVRATAAIFAASTSCMFYSGAAYNPDELRAIILEIATDLAG